MADAPPTPQSGPEAPPMERRPSSERKKSTEAAAAAGSSAAATSPPAEGQPSAATEAAADTSPDLKPSSAAVVGTAEEAASSADAKSPVEGEQKPDAAAGSDGAPAPSPEGATPPPAAAGSSPDPSKASTPTENRSPEKKEELINLQWDYNTPLPNCYFRPSLMDLCVPVMAKNFVKYPRFGGISAEERLRVVNEIPLDLPLKLAADMIPEEPYWKRRVQLRWRNCDIVAHGRSWKQTFLERNLQEALERYDATVENEHELIELMRISAPFVHNLDLVQLPSHFDFKLIFYVLQRDLTGLRVNYGILDILGAKFDWWKWGMKVSDCRSLSAALTITATLTTLNLAGNRIDAEKMGILAKGLMANPTVVDLDLSSNILRDEGVMQLAYVLKNPNSVLGILNLASNHVTPEGCRFLEECEDINRSLVSLNLTSNNFGDLGGKRILDWANNNPIIQRLSMECCDIGEDSVQSFTRLMHNQHSALTALNISGNHSIGVTGGETVFTGLEAGKQMKELWIANCNCGEDLQTKILNFLVERKYGRTCIHHEWKHEDRPSLLVPGPTPKAEAKPSEEEEKAKADKERQDKEEEEKRKKELEDEESEEEKANEEEERKKKEEEAAAAAEAAAKKKEEDKLKEEADLIFHVGHGHGEACTLECSRMVGLPSTKPPPEPVVYPETAFAARDAQAAIKKIDDAKPYWGLESLKDMKEKGT